MAEPKDKSANRRVAAWVAAPAMMIALAVPASAQFGSIFAPRPPADVPDTRYPSSDTRYPSQPRYRDQLPPEPPPPPLTRLPPLQRNAPPSGPVQIQPLPPPPGATAAPAPPLQGPNQTATNPPGSPGVSPNPLPGLPPGQRQPRGGPQEGTPQPGANPDEVVVAPPKQKIVNQTATFAGLDKITGRIISFEVTIDETVQFGALRLTPRACYTRPPTETPNTDGFFEVDEITLQGEVKRIFTGWMFAASPGLHGIEHPIYDIWLTDCKNAVQQAAVQEEPPPQRPAPPPRQQRPQQRQQPQGATSPQGGGFGGAQPVPPGFRR